MAKKSGDYALPIGTAIALLVGGLWTILTGGIWHWVPIVGGIVVALGAAKAVHADPKSGPTGPRKKKG